MGLSWGFVSFPYVRARAKANLCHEYCQISGGLIKASHFTADGELGLFQLKFKGRALEIPDSSYVEVNRSQTHSVQ